MTKVQYFGTCRIQEPLQSLHDDGRVNLLPRFWGFNHSAPEIVQMLGYCGGRTRVPAEHRAVLNLAHLAHPHYEDGANLVSCLDDVEVVFVEVSSLKTYRYAESWTQVNRLAEHFELPVPVIDRYLESRESEEQYQDRTSALDAVGFHRQTPDQLSMDVQRIIRDLHGAKIVLLNTFLVEDEKRHHFVAREQIREVLAKACEREYGVLHYDPTPRLTEYGVPIKDYSHYLDVFKAVLAEDFLELVRQAIRSPGERSRAA